VSFLHFYKAWKIWVVAIHAVDAFYGNNGTSVFMANVSQEAIELLKIVVAEAATCRLRSHRPLGNTFMSQFIVENEILGIKQMTKDRCIRAETTWKDCSSFRTNEVCNCIIERIEKCGVAANHTTGCSPTAKLVNCGFCSCSHCWMAGQAEIIKARKTDHVFATN